MLVLLAVPVMLSVALCHRMLQLHVPSNRLVRNARISGPTWRLVAAHALLALGCLLAMRLVTLAISPGATEILYLVVMLLAWDSIKFAASACLTFIRLSALQCRRYAVRFTPRTCRGAVAASALQPPARLAELAPSAAPQR